MAKLKNEIQIKILKEAKKNIMGCHYGLCGGIRHAIDDVLETCISNEDIPDFIPLFTKENAMSFCKRSKLKQPDFTKAYWWEGGFNVSRFAFINWMINELKKEL